MTRQSNEDKRKKSRRKPLKRYRLKNKWMKVIGKNMRKYDVDEEMVRDIQG